MPISTKPNEPSKQTCRSAGRSQLAESSSKNQLRRVRIWFIGQCLDGPSGLSKRKRAFIVMGGRGSRRAAKSMCANSLTARGKRGQTLWRAVDLTWKSYARRGSDPFYHGLLSGSAGASPSRSSAFVVLLTMHYDCGSHMRVASKHGFDAATRCPRDTTLKFYEIEIVKSWKS